MERLAGVSVHAEEAELLGLSGPDRDAALDAITSGAEFPYVIVSGVLACAGALDAKRVAGALRRGGMSNEPGV